MPENTVTTGSSEGFEFEEAPIQLRDMAAPGKMNILFNSFISTRVQLLQSV